MSNSPPQSPLVFNYNNYREFLKDLYDHRKKTTQGFSYRKLSSMAGFKSPNALKLVIEGKRNLTVRSLIRVARGFELNDEEILYFKKLVLLNQAKSSQEKRKHTSDLIQIESFKNLYPLKVAQYELYRRWYTVAIREMVVSPDFKEDAKWIASQLHADITADEIKQSIENLLVIGLLERDSNGRLIQSQKDITTGHEIESSTIVDFHRRMIELAAVAIDKHPRSEREVSGSTLFLTEESFQKLKVLIQDFRRSLLTLESCIPSGPRAVYQINFQAFPLSHFITGEEDEKESKTA